MHSHTPLTQGGLQLKRTLSINSKNINFLTTYHGTIRSTSVAALLLGVGSGTPLGAITFAVLLSVPVAVDAIVHAAVNVTVALAGNDVIVCAMLPEIGLDGQVALIVLAHVEEQVSVDGNESDTVAPLAALGPLFVTSIVYVTDEPDRPKFD